MMKPKLGTIDLDWILNLREVSKPLSWVEFYEDWRVVSVIICPVVLLCCHHSQIISFDIVELEESLVIENWNIEYVTQIGF